MSGVWNFNFPLACRIMRLKKRKDTQMKQNDENTLYKIGSFLLDKLFSTDVSTPFLLFRIYFVDGSENIEAAVDSCRNLIVETRLRSDYPSLYLRLLGVMTISKDATTSKRELFELSEYLSTKR